LHLENRSNNLIATLNVLVPLLLLVLGSVAGAASPPCGAILASYASATNPSVSVAAMSNEPNQFSKNDCQEPPGPYGDLYQCVEFVRRFYSQALGVDTSPWAPYNAVDYFTTPSLGLRPFENGGSESPQPDDIVVFGRTAKDSAGHVAIVNAVTADHVYVIEQNWSLDGTATLTRDAHNFVSRPNSALPVLGWMRRVNITGSWSVDISVTMDTFPNPIQADHCVEQHVQSGASIVSTGTCDVTGSFQLTGTIDLTTGAMSESGTAQGCPAGVEITGMISPDNDSISGTWNNCTDGVHFATGTFVSSRTGP